MKIGVHIPAGHATIFAADCMEHEVGKMIPMHIGSATTDAMIESVGVVEDGTALLVTFYIPELDLLPDPFGALGA